MKIYQVIDKVFYTSNGIEYQRADALTQIQAYSSKKKVMKAFESYIKYYEDKGYKKETEYMQLFPLEHQVLKNESLDTKLRVVIYINESEVK